MISSINFRLRFPSRLKSRTRLCLALTVALFSFPVLAQTYPVSGVWIAAGHHFPDSKAGACAALKILGVDAVRDKSFPTVVFFSGGKRFEIRPNYEAERAINSIKSEGAGDFRIVEWLGERRWPWSRKQSYTLRVLGPATIEITERKVATRFGNVRQLLRPFDSRQLAGIWA